jgi:hypothetical protein
MKLVDVSIFAIGLGLILLSFALRKQKKKNWLGLFAGGVTMLVLGLVSRVFGLSL